MYSLGYSEVNKKKLIPCITVFFSALLLRYLGLMTHTHVSYLPTLTLSRTTTSLFNRRRSELLLLLLGLFGTGLLEVVSAGCSITPEVGTGKVTIPESWTSIPDNAFSGCISLQTVVFESGSKLQTIGEKAFYQSNLNAFTFPSSLTSVKDYAFGDANLLQGPLEFPSSVKSIGEFAFLNCDFIESISFACGSTTSVADSAFSGTSATAITMPSTVTYTGSVQKNYHMSTHGSTDYCSTDYCSAFCSTDYCCTDYCSAYCPTDYCSAYCCTDSYTLCDSPR